MARGVLPAVPEDEARRGPCCGLALRKASMASSTNRPPSTSPALARLSFGISAVPPSPDACPSEATPKATVPHPASSVESHSAA